MTVARFLLPYGRGVWAVSLQLAALLSLVAELGLAAALLYYLRSRPERSSAIVGTALALAVTAAAAASAVALVFIHTGHLPMVGGVPKPVLYVALIGPVVASAWGVGRQALLGMGDLRGHNRSGAIQQLTLLPLLLAFLLVRVDVLLSVVAYVLSLAVAAVFTSLWLLKRHSISFAWDGRLVRPLVSYGLRAHLGTAALFLMYRFDILLVNHYLGPSAAGTYSVALSLSEILRVIAEVAQLFLLSRSASDIVEDTHRTCGRAILVSAVLGVGAAACSHSVIPFVFGEGFREAAGMLWGLIPGVVALAVSYSVAPMLLFAGRVAANTKAPVVGFVVMVVLDVVAIPRMGALAAAFVSSLAYATMAAFQVREAQRHCGFRCREIFRLNAGTPRA